MWRALLAALALAVLALAPAARAATLTKVGDFTDPVFVTSDPSDPDRLFVVEQAGRIQLANNGVVSAFLDLASPGMVAAGGERGLLSMAPAPDFATSGRFYVYYTRSGPSDQLGDLQIDEYTASGDTAAVSTRRPILTIDHPAGNHNGGQLQFGPDGYLYLATGDGGGAGDTSGNAQSLNTLLGKVLRIDPTPSGGAPYSIPPGNPFAGPTGGLDEIWSYGLRNPWRFSFDRLTGDLLIGDVGQGSREEVDYRAGPQAGRGDNFGWNCREGSIAFPTAPPSCVGATGFVEPIFDYGHSGGACAITGGYLVRDQSLGDLYGRYLFADECVGEIRSLAPASPRATDVRSEGLEVSGPASFGEDSCGRVYVTSLGDDELLRFDGAAPADCSTPPPASARSCAGRAATRVPGADGAVIGSPGDDVIVADERRNRIRAKGGDDVICGLAGGDRILGGGGDDRIHAGRGDDRCRGGGGDDRLRSC